MQRYKSKWWVILYDYSNTSCRKTRWFYKPIQWLGNTNLIRYNIGKFINLFDKKKGKTLKERWNYWGGGGKITWWVRNHITHD